MPNITQFTTNILGGSDAGLIAVTGSISGELGSTDPEIAIFLRVPGGAEIHHPGVPPADFGYQPVVSLVVTSCRDCDLFLT